MSWEPRAQWQYGWDQSRNGRKKQEKGDQGKAKGYTVGYDGTRLEWPSSSRPAPHAPSKEEKKDAVSDIKAFLQEMAEAGTLPVKHPMLQKIIGEARSDDLR